MKLKPFLFVFFAFFAGFAYMAKGNNHSNQTISDMVCDEQVEAEIYAAFEPITGLSDYLLSDGYSENSLVPNELQDQVLQLSNNQDFVQTQKDNSAYLNTSAFIMGCAFGPVGVIVVYIVSGNNKPEFYSSMAGCVVGNLLFWTFFIIIGGEFSFNYY